MITKRKPKKRAVYNAAEVEHMRANGWETIPAALKKTGIPKSTLYRWLEAGEVTATKCGHRRYVKLSSLEARLRPETEAL